MRSAHRSLQLVHSIDKGLVEDKHAVGLGHPDHVHSAAVPPRALKVQVTPTRLHQVLGSLYAQPSRSMPATVMTTVVQHRHDCHYHLCYNDSSCKCHNTWWQASHNIGG